jgi:glycine/D-amino acid oxidase-like deaminating enzyme
LQQLDAERGAIEPDWEMLDREALAKLLPLAQLGQEVTGASFGSGDGHANPLRLLTALQKAILAKRGRLKGGATVGAIRRNGDGSFTIDLGSERVSASLVVVAAGLGSQELAAQLGLDIPIRPQRGQILVTERLEPFLPLPMTDIRQTREGTVMIGATHDETGYDNSATTAAAAALSAMAIRWLPALAEAKLVRQWGGLRILTPDSYPVYAESETHPGAFVAVCHSGVTLAALHATLLADSIAAGSLPPSFDAFHHRRFDVPKVA